MKQARATIDHEQIKQWVDERGGHPAVVASTGEHGLLRIDFEPADDSLEQIDWDTFFDTFERKELAFLHQDTTSGGEQSRFNKFIDRNSAEAANVADVAENKNSANSGDKSRRRTKSKSSGDSANRSSKRASGSSK